MAEGITALPTVSLTVQFTYKIVIFHIIYIFMENTLKRGEILMCQLIILIWKLKTLCGRDR